MAVLDKLDMVNYIEKEPILLMKRKEKRRVIVQKRNIPTKRLKQRGELCVTQKRCTWLVTGYRKWPAVSASALLLDHLIQA
jgi:hypothetical protein